MCASPNPLEALLGLIERANIADQNRPSAMDCAPMDDSIRIEGSVHIGRDVTIGSDAILIGPAAIGDSARLGKGAVISRSIVLPGRSVPDNGHCHNTIVGADFTTASHEFATKPPVPPHTATFTIQTHRVQRAAKRCLDVVAAATGLILLAPLCAAVALAIKLTSPGPVLYGHRRQGRGGVEFNCWKFRTMVRDAEAIKRTLQSENQVDGPQFKITDDPRVTRVGRWLRSTNIDELPQLVNVLLGQMSLVGPRPSPDNENQWCPAWRRARLSVLPGITGPVAGGTLDQPPDHRFPGVDLLRLAVCREPIVPAGPPDYLADRPRTVACGLQPPLARSLHPKAHMIPPPRIPMQAARLNTNTPFADSVGRFARPTSESPNREKAGVI